MVCKQGWVDESNEKMEILTKDSQAVKLIVSEKTVAEEEEIWKTEHFCSILAWGVSKPSRMSIQSVQFSHSVMSDFLQHHSLQHARLPFPSPTPGACSNSCPRVGDAIQQSHPLLTPFSSCLQSLPTSGSFPVRQPTPVFLPGESQGRRSLVGCHLWSLTSDLAAAAAAAAILCIKWPKYWSFSFSISSSKEYSGLISFRIDWFDFLGLSRVLSNTTVKSINSSALSFL